MFNTGFRVDQKVLRKSIVLCSLMLFHVQVVLAQSAWQDANRLVDALGGWRAYLQERANTPENYPQIPSTEEMFRLKELLEFPASTVERVAQRRLASERTRIRSAPISPPTLSYAITESEEERSQEWGIHLPIGAWLERSSSLASDDSNWGTAESEALRLESLHSRLLSYAEAVAAKAELTQTLDRVEISRILEEFLKRQRSIQAIPEGELLAIRMELVDAEAQADLANARLLRTVEELAYQLGLSVEETSSLVDSLPLEPEVIPELPTVPKVRLDLQQSRDLIALRESEQGRATVSQWMGGLELGWVQEQSDAGHESQTVEISWRLPFGGEGSKRSQISQFQLEEAQAELELRHLQIKQEQREV
ncbi:MAG: TolC family protein, partial [Deltaproteobacteria bacterium]|nr:TolC family protein [Deltaproteobacteria bacterium]